MKTIRYEFCDGTVNEVEVSDELCALHDEMVQLEKRNHWKNTRRHISLEYLNRYEIDIEESDSDPLVKLIKSEDTEKLHKAITYLSLKQRVLIEKIFFGDMTMTAIAEQENVSQQAISKQIAVIYKKLKKLL